MLKQHLLVALLSPLSTQLTAQPKPVCTSLEVERQIDSTQIAKLLTIDPYKGILENSLLVSLLKGDCADQIVDGVIENYRLADGRLIYRSRDKYLPVEPGRNPLPLERPSAVPVKLMGATFVMAGNIGVIRSESSPVTAYVGLWRSRNHSIVARFLSTGGKPVILITTPAEILSARYFPSPDTPSGSLTLIMRRSGKTSEAWLSWIHPDYLEWGKK